MNCPKCNAPISENSRFCTNCGEAIAATYYKEQRIDKLINQVALICCIISLLSFVKVLTIILLIVSIVLLAAIIVYGIKRKKLNYFGIVLSSVSIINSVLWLIFIFNIYDKLV